MHMWENKRILNIIFIYICLGTQFLLAQPLKFYDRVDTADWLHTRSIADDKAGWLAYANDPQGGLIASLYDYCGELVYSSTFSSVNSSLQASQAIFIGNGRYVLSWLQDSGAGIGLLDNGNMIFARHYDVAASFLRESKLVLLDNNDLLLCIRYIDDIGRGQIVCMIIQSSDLTVRSAKQFSSLDFPFDVAALQNDGYAICYNENDLVSFDGNGDPIWARNFANRSWLPESITSQDSSLFLATEVLPASNGHYAQLIKLHENGSEIWETEAFHFFSSGIFSAVDPSEISYVTLDTLMGDSIHHVQQYTFDASGTHSASTHWSLQDSVGYLDAQKLSDDNFVVAGWSGRTRITFKSKQVRILMPAKEKR